MCLLSSVLFRFCFNLNDALWFANLALKLVAVIPTCASSLLSHVTVGWYTMLLARHSPSRGHVAIFGQLHFLELHFSVSSSFLLFPPITAFMFGIQLYKCFTVFLLKILYILLLGGEHLVMILKNSFPMLVFTLKS